MTLENGLAAASHAANVATEKKTTVKKASVKKAASKKTAAKKTAKGKAAAAPRAKADDNRKIKVLKAFDPAKFRGSRRKRAELLKDSMLVSEYAALCLAKTGKRQILDQLLEHEMVHVG
jgi:hypothetical protein